MADKREVVIVGAARAPIGAYGGSLKDFSGM
jgi:acetyl-CoA C-acetyltransferase